MKIYFREFEDGDYELGVLETWMSTYFVMNVGDFAYGFYLGEWIDEHNIKQFLKMGRWTYIGRL